MMTKTVYHRRELEKYFVFAQAVKAGPFVFVSGCLAWDRDGNVVSPGDWPAQVAQVYDDIEATLRNFDLTLKDVVKETIYCSNMDRLVEVSGIRSSRYDSDSPPAATWVEVSRLVNRDLLLEVEVLALATD